MKTYIIKKTSTADVCWETIPELSLDERYLDTPEDAKAWAQICYNEEAMFVHLWANEKEIRREETGLLGEPYHDSCLEFFFSPEGTDQRYFNMEFNSNRCLYLGFGAGLGTATRLIVDIDAVFSPKVNFSDDGWEIFYTVPFSFIRRFFPDFTVTEGKTIRANCYKCADEMTPGHFLSWNPVNTDPLSFHAPDCFGEMTFGD